MEWRHVPIGGGGNFCQQAEEDLAEHCVYWHMVLALGTSWTVSSGGPLECLRRTQECLEQHFKIEDDDYHHQLRIESVILYY